MYTMYRIHLQVLKNEGSPVSAAYSSLESSLKYRAMSMCSGVNLIVRAMHKSLLKSSIKVSCCAWLSSADATRRTAVQRDVEASSSALMDPNWKYQFLASIRKGHPSLKVAYSATAVNS